MNGGRRAETPVYFRKFDGARLCTIIGAVPLKTIRFQNSRAHHGDRGLQIGPPLCRRDGKTEREPPVIHELGPPALRDCRIHQGRNRLFLTCANAFIPLPSPPNGFFLTRCYSPSAAMCTRGNPKCSCMHYRKGHKHPGSLCGRSFHDNPALQTWLIVWFC